MFCKQCGKELDDGVTFCPGCGTPVAAEAVPASAEAPVITKSAPAKKSRGWIIPVIAAVLALAVLGAWLGGVFDSPATRLGKALAKSSGVFTAALAETGLNDAGDLLVRNDHSQTLSFWLDQAEDAPELAGLGIRISTNASITDRKAEMELAPYLGAADLLKLQMKIDNEKYYLGSPELTKDAFFMVDTTTIGETMARLLGAEELRTISFNIFDIAAEIQKQNAASAEAKAAMLAAYQEFTQTIQVTKTGKETVTVNGQALSCTAYHAVITEAAMDQLLYDMEDACKMADNTQAYMDMLAAMGLPEEITGQMGYDNTDEIDEIFLELHDALKQLGEIELDLYENKGYVVAAVYADTIDESAVEFVLHVGGGKNYADDISLRITVDGQTLSISSTGNHTGENGQFTDKTEITTTEDGTTETVAVMELAYAPKTEADNFSWTLTAGEATFSAAGQVTFGKNTLFVCLDEIVVNEMVTLGLEYQMGGYQGEQITVSSQMALDEMTEEDLAAAMEDLSLNAQMLLMELMEQFPDLFYFLS